MEKDKRCLRAKDIMKMDMKKHIRDEKTDISYTLQGDYYIPDLKVDESDDRTIGIFGQMHGRYLQENKKAVYYSMLIDGTLADYLADINKQAQEIFERIINDTREAEGLTEEFKAENPMEWIRRMNNIVEMAREFVLQEIVYV